MLSTLLVVAMVACIAIMVSEQLRQHRRLAREHQTLLDEAEGILGRPVRGSDQTGLPVLTGTHDGRDVRLDVMIDSLALRKLPRLFLRGAIHRRLGVPAPIHAQRPSVGSGMVENDRLLEKELPTPAGWPEEVVVRTTADGPDQVPETLLAAGEVFADPRTLSLLAAPRGLRLTWEVARGDVAAWRVSRGARFGEHVPAEVADRLLTTAGEIAEALPAGRASGGAPAGPVSGPRRARGGPSPSSP